MDDEDKPKKGFARQLARTVIGRIAAPYPPVMIRDVVAFIKKDTSLTVYSWSFSAKISGILAQTKAGSNIAYNNSHHRHRQRFTVAHEIGHCLLGHTCSGADYNFKSKDPREVEANQFASELLMPLQNLKDACKTGIDVEQLATTFDVSKESMWYKLMDSNLIK